MQRRTFAGLITSTIAGASTIGTVASESETCDPHTEYCPKFDPDLQLGTTVETTTALNVRSGPGLDNDVQFTVPEGALGRVVARGPINDHYWLRVEWETHRGPYGQHLQGSQPFGWSAAEFLEPAASQTRTAFDFRQSITTGSDVTIQTEPASESTVEGTAPRGTGLMVFQGPIDTLIGTPPVGGGATPLQQADRWWRVVGGDLAGWARESELVADFNGNPAAFEMGDRVSPTTGLSVREAPSLDASRLTVVSPDDTGQIALGDAGVFGDFFQNSFFPTWEGTSSTDRVSYLWWKVDWESGPTGWSVQAYLTDE